SLFLSHSDFPTSTYHVTSLPLYVDFHSNSTLLPTHYIFFFLILRPPCSTLFPYTTLFRSGSDRLITGPLNHENFFALTDAVNDKDRKSTRLNSSHVSISYAVFCLKKKNLTLFVDLGNKST